MLYLVCEDLHETCVLPLTLLQHVVDQASLQVVEEYCEQQVMGNEPLGISDPEREVLKILWEHGPVTVRQIRAHLAEIGTEWPTRPSILCSHGLNRNAA